MLYACMQALARGDVADTELCVVPAMDGDQYIRQTEGWQDSWQVLKAAMELHGPFDGIMGFSQVSTCPSPSAVHGILQKALGACQRSVISAEPQPYMFHFLFRISSA